MLQYKCNCAGCGAVSDEPFKEVAPKVHLCPRDEAATFAHLVTWWADPAAQEQSRKEQDARDTATREAAEKLRKDQESQLERAAAERVSKAIVGVGNVPFAPADIVLERIRAHRAEHSSDVATAGKAVLGELVEEMSVAVRIKRAKEEADKAVAKAEDVAKPKAKRK